MADDLKPKLSPRVEALELNLQTMRVEMQQLAKGMRRAEKFAEDYGNETLMEKCEVAGVKFPGTGDDDDDET